jgi:opacity protein-like surface antigen
MRKRNQVVAAVAAATLLAAGAARAQTVQQRLDALEKKVDDSQKSMASLLGIEIHGLVAMDYNYNLNGPDSKTNRIHVFDQDSNSIDLNQANINIQRKVPAGLGFNLDLDFGKTAEVVGATTQWRSNSSTDRHGLAGSNSSIDLRQAYVTYAFADTPFSLQAGKFVTYHGAEVIKSYNNLNYNISNSILFGFSIPFTHTGLLGTYTMPNDLGSISAGVVNGWDNVVDNNDGKSLHGMVTLTPDPMVTFAVSTTYGAEQDNRGDSKRLMISPLVTVKPTDQWTFILDYNYGNESNVSLCPGGSRAGCVTPATSVTGLYQAPGNAMWQGAAAYVVFAPTADWQFALRGEVFDDPDGVRTLFQQAGSGPGATFWEFTPTVAYKITDNLTARAEYRHDESDKGFFDAGSRTVANGDRGLPGQDMIATELIYAF